MAEEIKITKEEQLERATEMALSFSLSPFYQAKANSFFKLGGSKRELEVIREAVEAKIKIAFKNNPHLNLPSLAFVGRDFYSNCFHLVYEYHSFIYEECNRRMSHFNAMGSDSHI